MAKIDYLWDEEPIDITNEANFIWSIANKLRGTYMPDKYGDVIIPMTILRRFECVLAPTKDEVIKKYEENNGVAPQVLQDITGYEFYNTSYFTLAELCNDDEKNMAADFEFYLDSFSSNVQEIFKELNLKDHIKTMDEKGCLLQIIKTFSELDLSVETFDSIKMGYIFENLIGRFFQNVDAGQYYTGRDIIKLMVSILISEGCDDIFQENKVITICDQACGTGGMLTTSYNYLKHYNPTSQIILFGQEYMGTTYAIGLAEMLIKGQKSDNFRNADTFKEDCFLDRKMRFVLENPPFGTPWKGKDAKAGQEEAVKKEYEKHPNGRWGAGLPAGGDSQLIFLQSAIDKMDENKGRAAIIQNGSSLFKGDTSSGESQIRKSLLQRDLIEAIIALPTDLFYNTGIATYIWILSKNKRVERKGKIQLIDASSICHKLRKAVGAKKNEINPDDRKQIAELYTNFEENEYCKIFNNEEFMYREYAVMQPLQRSYGITEERIDQLKSNGSLSSFYDENKVIELTNSENELTDTEQKKLNAYLANEDSYNQLISLLKDNVNEKIYLSKNEFVPIINKILSDYDKSVCDKVVKGLSIIDKNAVIEKDKKGNIIYDKDTKDKEIVGYTEDIQTYMEREVLPYVPDAKEFFEGDENDINNEMIGAEIPFTRIFFKFSEQKKSDDLIKEFKDVDRKLNEKIKKLVE